MYNYLKHSMKKESNDDIYSELNPGICSACGGKLYFEKVSLDHYEAEKLYVIEDVPAFICEECGEVWIPKPVIEELEKMIAVYVEKEMTGKPPIELRND